MYHKDNFVSEIITNQFYNKDFNDRILYYKKFPFFFFDNVLSGKIIECRLIFFVLCISIFFFIKIINNMLFSLMFFIYKQFG